MQDNHAKPEIYRNDQVRAAIQELFSYEDFLAGMEAFVAPQLNKLILDEKDTVRSAEDFQRKVISPFTEHDTVHLHEEIANPVHSIVVIRAL